MPDSLPYDEKGLFLRIGEGDEKAFRTLFHNYIPLVRSVVIKVAHDEQLLPDLMQEVFLKIWLCRDQLAGIESPRSWILRMVYNKIFNWIKSQKLKEARYPELAAEAISGGAAVHYDPAVLAEIRQVVAKAVHRLPEQTRKVYQLNREQGYSISEIAARLELAPQTVKNTLGRSMSSIREYLRDNGIVLPLLAIYFLAKM